MIEQVAESLCFGGRQLRFRHRSQSLSCEMHFSVYLPPQAKAHPVPAVLFLSGLTCTDENFVTKAGAQQYASKYGLAIINPDTSPRGEGVTDAAEGEWDLGLGAGFYVNATQSPWSEHYRMYDYVTDELLSLVTSQLPIDAHRLSISGHSMGGHGALMIGLKNPELFRSISAFSPICAPSQCPWGQKAFSHYLGEDQEAWKTYDSCELLKTTSPQNPLMVDFGSADSFLEDQLQPEILKSTCEAHQHPLQLRTLEGYDHSYFFIATFIEDHLQFHSQQLH